MLGEYIRCRQVLEIPIHLDDWPSITWETIKAGTWDVLCAKAAVSTAATTTAAPETGANNIVAMEIAVSTATPTATTTAVPAVRPREELFVLQKGIERELVPKADFTEKTIHSDTNNEQKVHANVRRIPEKPTATKITSNRYSNNNSSFDGTVEVFAFSPQATKIAPATTKEFSKKLHDTGPSFHLAPVSAAEYLTPVHGISLVSEGSSDDDNPEAVVAVDSTPREKPTATETDTAALFSNKIASDVYNNGNFDGTAGIFYSPLVSFSPQRKFTLRAPAPTKALNAKLHGMSTRIDLDPISAAKRLASEHEISLASEGNFDDDNPEAIVAMDSTSNEIFFGNEESFDVTIWNKLFLPMGRCQTAMETLPF